MIRIILALVLLSSTIAFSQEKTFEKEVRKISKKIDQITSQHKDSLKQKIKEVNLKLKKNEITNEKATELKKNAASYHAKQIELNAGIQEYKLQQLVQDKVDGKIASEDKQDGVRVSFFDKDFFVLRTNKKEKKKIYNKRTTTQFVFAMGVNNVLENNNFGSLNSSDYKFWQSHFYELGFTFKTRFTKEPSKTYFKYGISFLWNNLRPKNNQYHVEDDTGVLLEENVMQLTESRLRHVQMIFPMHLEFDFSENKTLSDDTVVDNTHDGIRLGLGGFFGFKLGTRQYLEFKNNHGTLVEELQRGDFNMNTVNYGLSGYLAYEGIGVYVKYDLNPLFQNTSTRNISLGVRLDLN
ncbi:hypothetical protein SAMN04489761_0419 [Tenacibaculum sp. MAR_2009_124]|uniref:hypothetical protein n=1 Tax=Tenacibaculum sp. MAR_2009_124 TaxID=1250059 RepID=UPI000896508E|nr:hypothetical protein [Tenacibaculum sp. MAR_2009_124]SEB39463.1 hypothetical protein SAMN04489761_0419 [Tenacibaculum sp. MAR_2009_124]